MRSYEIIISFNEKTLILRKKADFSILNHVKAQFGHFLQNLRRGYYSKKLKIFCPKMADLGEKSFKNVYISTSMRSYEIIISLNEKR